MLKSKRKRLYFDIETSPNVGLFWSAGYKQNIDYSNIIKERAIICICYKWEDEKETYALTWDSKQDDKKMLIEFIKIANQADELIGHNGDKFDLAWIRTRCLFHKIDMFPKYTTIDTLKISTIYENSLSTNVIFLVPRGLSIQMLIRQTVVSNRTQPYLRHCAHTMPPNGPT